MAERCLEQLLLGCDGRIASLLTKALGTSPEEGGGKRLGDGHGERGDDTSEDHVDPENPPPANSLTDEATDDRTENGSTVRCCGEERDCETTLVVVPDVGDRTAGEGEGCGGEEATEESTDKERLDVGSNGAGNIENDVEETGDDPDGSAAIQLTLRIRSAKVP